MRQAQHGDVVTVKYIGTLDNGRIFDSSTDENPLVFTIGENQVFPALEKEVLAMCIGETRNFIIPMEEAFGPRLKENMLKVERASLPSGKAPVVGEKVQIEFRGGIERLMLISEVDETTVMLDGN